MAMEIEGLTTDDAAPTTKAAGFWGSKDKAATAILAAVKAARDEHAARLAKDANAQPKKVVKFTVSADDAAQWKVRINSQLRAYLTETKADTGIRKFEITPVAGNKRQISFVPAVKRSYEKDTPKS